MADNPKPRYFTTCDVARCAKNCVEDTDAEPIDVLVCVAKQLGYTQLMVSLEKTLKSDDEQLRDELLLSEGLDLEFLKEELPGKPKPKITTHKLFRFMRWWRAILFNIVEFALAQVGLLNATKVLVEVLTGMEYVNIERIARKDKERDKDNKEICDCDPTGGDNRWYEQERDDKGRFLPK